MKKLTHTLYFKETALPKWDKRFIELAEHIAQWSKDPSTKVGAVVVRPDNTIVSTGYNGFARSIEDSNMRLEDRLLKYPFTVHAEMNAMLSTNESLKGCTIYVYPLTPCPVCMGAIVQKGISRVVCKYVGNRIAYDGNYEITKQMIAEAGIKFTLIEG